MSLPNGIGIIGEGRLALALAQLIAARGEALWMWAPTAERRRLLQEGRRDDRVLPEVEALDERVELVDDPSDLARHCRLVLLADLSAEPIEVLDVVGAALNGAHQVVHADHRLHGAELATTGALLHRHTCVRQIGAAAGPVHVGELLAGKPNAFEVGSPFPKLVQRFRKAVDFPNVRVYESADLLGVELSAALVRIVALAIGLADALGAGAAAHATLMVRGMAEVRRIGAALDASAQTFGGLAGLGNLLDGARRGSPDYDLGSVVAEGVVGEALIQQAPAEASSLALIPLVRAFAQDRELRVPMTATLDEIISGGIKPETVLAELMGPSQVAG